MELRAFDCSSCGQKWTLRGEETQLSVIPSLRCLSCKGSLAQSDTTSHCVMDAVSYIQKHYRYSGVITAATLSALLATYPVESVDISEHGALRAFTLTSGQKLHLGVSKHGPVVVHIEEKRS